MEKTNHSAYFWAIVAFFLLSTFCRAQDNTTGDVNSQYVVFQIQPTGNPIIMLDGENLEVVGGTAMKRKKFGTYEYRVDMDGYHSEIGEITVNDPQNKHLISITMRPAFGAIEIPETKELAGASVFLDNKLEGTVPLTIRRVASGQHNIRIVKPLYSPFEQTVTVKDGETTTVKALLSSNSANVTLNVDGNAEIWVNGERKGLGSWTGTLEHGTYQIETRKTSHQTQSEVYTISEDIKIELNAPVPIYGSLNISVLPDGSEIYINGKHIGETPMFVQEALVGKTTIKVKKEGYGELIKTVELAEDQTVEIEGSLSKSTNVTFECNNSNATIYIDGENKGKIASTYDLAYGEHAIRLTAPEYHDLEMTINVQSNTTNSFRLSLEAIFGNKTFTVNGVKFKMIAVEGGTFQMGSETGYDNEKPVHSVTLSSYYIGETEVTQALWKAVMGSTPSHFKGDNLPVETVYWNDCQKFITKLNQLTGKQFHLPTEAEWEFAARGGTKSKGYIYSGSNNIGEVAWCGNNSSDMTHEVATKSPNELGIYDMSGNVSEWCQDWFGTEYYRDSPTNNPKGPDASGLGRVERGGYCIRTASSVSYCRTTRRHYESPSSASSSLGLRLALSK